MAVMEYLDPQVYRALGPGDGSNSILMDEVERVVTALHAGGFAHGDIRDVNMMTRHEWRTHGTSFYSILTGLGPQVS